MNLRVFTLNCRNGLKPVIKNELLHSAFNVRYQVYHNEMGIVPENSEREIYDEYDFMKATSIFLVLDSSKPIGTMRLTKYSENIKLPIFKNLEKELKSMLNIQDRIKMGRKFAEISRFTVLKDYRKGRSYVQSILTCLVYDQCVFDEVTDIVIVANPSQSKLYKKAGFEVFGIKKDTLTHIKSPAMHAEVSDGFGQFIKYLKSILKKNCHIHLFNHSGEILHESVNL